MNRTVEISSNGVDTFKINLTREYLETRAHRIYNGGLKFLGIKGKFLKAYDTIYNTRNYKTALKDYKLIYNHCNDGFNNNYSEHGFINDNDYLTNSKYLNSIQKIRKDVNYLLHLVNDVLSMYI